MKSANYINHIALVLDASSSMNSLTQKVIQVADEQVQHLAMRSKELDQETRITVYTFSDSVQCVFYEKDVLRLPSIKEVYRTSGMTALIDATIQSQDDLDKTAQLYGDHAFLTYVLTDGQENRSKRSPRQLTEKLTSLPDHWSIGVLVPNKQGEDFAKRFGFFAGSIAIWDATSAQGLEDAASLIRNTTDSFMQARSTGNFRGTRGLFDMSAANLNPQVVKSALVALQPGKYQLLDITKGADLVIAEFVRKHGYSYKMGMAFYQLSKPEDIQKQKAICVLDKKTKKVYTGDQARDLLGLPDYTIRVRPSDNPNYDVFVQSTSVNRKLVEGTTLLIVP